MRVCPRCARANKPRAKFCDQCGFQFLGYAGSAASTRRARPPDVHSELPPGDTAKGVSGTEAGVPRELRAHQSVHHDTKKMGSASPAAGVVSAAAVDSQETIKLARASSPTRDLSGAAKAANAEVDLEPEATVQGAFYLRKQEALGGPTATAEQVGWLTEPSKGESIPGAMNPVREGITLIGSDPELVGTGVLARRGNLAGLHAMVFHRGGRTWVVDMASSAGTLLNGQSIEPLQGHSLSDRDELRLGDLILSFSLSKART